MLLIAAYYTLNQFRVMKNQNKLKIIKYKKQYIVQSYIYCGRWCGLLGKGLAT